MTDNLYSTLQSHHKKVTSRITDSEASFKNLGPHFFDVQVICSKNFIYDYLDQNLRCRSLLL